MKSTRHNCTYALLASLSLFACGGDANTDNDASIKDAGAIDATVPATLCTATAGTDLELELVASGLADPIFVTAPKGDPRLFVVEKPGTIKIVKDGEILPTPYLDIRALIQEGSEQGLLGMAFHPRYTENGRFFVHYSAKGSGDTVIAEYRVSGNADVAESTGQTIFGVVQTQTNHNGGMIAFGPKGYLHIALGDGGGSNDNNHGPDGNGQNLQSHLGKLLRLDIDVDVAGTFYKIPADNPYAQGGGLPEIWAYGLRNPWRFSFDSKTDDLYIGDVGQKRLEEINVQPAATAGVNYGWRIAEGTECFNPADSTEPLPNCDTTGMVGPVAEYDHTQGRRSVSGGYVYRGQCLPDIDGWYFYADYSTAQVYTFTYANGEAQNITEMTELTPPGNAQFLSSFGQDGYGELYFVYLSGSVFRLVAKK